MKTQASSLFAPPSTHLIARLGKGALVSVSAIAGLSFFPTLFVAPALAHHPLNGQLPSNFFEGFMSGLAHPVLGPDHFLFVLAIGALAATRIRGWWMPVAFVVTSSLGSLLHLQGVDVPLLEIVVAGSLMLAGWLLARSQQTALGVMLGLGAIAGLFHGYAYAEAIFGAEMTPLAAYLAGLTVVQLAIALSVCQIAQQLKNQKLKGLQVKGIAEAATQPLRYAGFTFFGAGLAFLANVLV